MTTYTTKKINAIDAAPGTIADADLVMVSATAGVAGNVYTRAWSAIKAAITAAGLYVQKIGDTMTGALTINRNATAAPTPVTEVSLHVVGVDGNTIRIGIDAFGVAGAPGFIGRRARGTNAAPSAVQNTDVLCALNGFGYGATGYIAASRAVIQLMAAENWTDTANGTRLSFRTTANLGSTQSERWGVENDGSFIYSGGALTGDGTVNANNYFDNGVNISAIYAGLAVSNTFTGLNTFNRGAGVATSISLIGDGNTANFNFQRSSNNTTAPDFRARKSRGSATVPTAVNTNDILGRIVNQGYGATDFQDAAYTRVLAVAATPSDTDMESAWDLQLAPAGSVTPGTVLYARASTGLSIGAAANVVIDQNRLLRRRVYTFGTLPAAGIAGRCAAISDGAVAPVFNAAAAGGGAVYTNVTDNGVAWVNG
jgi:hypothetical protein